MYSIPKTKITRGWLVKGLVVFALLLLIGCTPQVPFQEYSATSASNAVDELMRRREDVTDFEAECVFELNTPKKKMKLNGNVLFVDNGDWQIKFTGPLGIEIAEVITTGDEFEIRSKMLGADISGLLSENMQIPGFEKMLPDLRTLTRAIMPVVDIRQLDGWKLQKDVSKSSEEISLIRNDGQDKYELMLKLEYSPLRVIRERRVFNGELIYQRDYSYKSKRSTNISEISIHIEKIQLNIIYNTLTYNNFSHLDTDFGTFQ